MKPTHALAVALLAASALSSQQQQVLTGQFGPTRITLPIYTSRRTTETDTRIVDFTVPQFNPALGTLCHVEISGAHAASVDFVGILNSPRSFDTGLNANLRLFWFLSSPGVTKRGPNRWFNQSDTIRAGNRVSQMSYAQQSATGRFDVPRAAHPAYVGTGNYRVRLEMQFDQEVTTSAGSLQWQFEAVTQTVLTVTYTYTNSNSNLASASTYGAGCPGTGGLAPVISAPSLPLIGNVSFSADLAQARANTAAAAVLSNAPAMTTIVPGCSLLVAPPLLGAAPVMTDGGGMASTPLPIPNDPSQIGGLIYIQYVVADPNGAAFGAFTLSDGLALKLGC